MQNNEFTIYIKFLRASHNLSLKALSNLTRYSPGYLSDLEKETEILLKM